MSSLQLGFIMNIISNPTKRNYFPHKTIFENSITTDNTG